MNRKHDQAYRGKITSPLDNLFGDSTDETGSNLVDLELVHLPMQQKPRSLMQRHCLNVQPLKVAKQATWALVYQICRLY